MRKEKAGAANSGNYYKLDQFLNSFNFKHTKQKVQCLNCGFSGLVDKFIAATYFEKAENKAYIFRLCRDCFTSFKNSTGEIRTDFCANIIGNLKTAEENNR